LALKIRMKRMGSKKRPFYRIVAADSRSPRDGRFIDTLGYYNPMSDPPVISFDDDKVFKWLGNGAKPTQNAAQVLRRAGLLERWQLLKAGVKIADLDSRIEEKRAKQPRPKPKTEKESARKDAEDTESPEEPQETGEKIQVDEPESISKSEDESADEEKTE